jgi:cell division transport system permease protein
MSLVLFIVGLIGIISIFAEHLSGFYRNNFEVFVFFNEDATAEMALKTESEIKKLHYVKSSLFVDREIAARKEIARTGNDFIRTLGYNPFPHSLELHLKPEAAEEKMMMEVESKLRHMPDVDDVVFAKDDFGHNLLAQINKNFKAIELVLASIALIFLIIAIVLINSTVRLNMFARRFIIKSMQYVGASDWFIIKPFLGMYLTYSLISTGIALSLLGTLVYLTERELQSNNWQLFLPRYGILAGILLILAIVIILLSVLFSTKRYLKLKIEQLY